MPRFRYSVIDSSGRRVTGERDASDPDALLAGLNVDVTHVESVQAIPEAVRSNALAAGSIGRGEAAEVSGHIAEIIDSQLPLESGLAAIAAECPSRKTRRTLRRIVADLARGS